MSKRKHMVLIQTGLIKYDSMTRAIAECREVDELKDYRDKARALELYAQQAKNRKAEAQAAEIRIRAEQASGTMASQGGDRKSKSDGTTLKTLSDVGVSNDQSAKWGGLADLPDEEFERRLSGTRERGDVPTTEGIIGKDPDITMIDKNAFAIGAALADVLDLKELDVEKIMQT